VRVRQFELRLLAVALTVLWGLGGLITLVAYRPGGPIDVFVGLAASLPLPVAAAAIVWPPLVRSDRGSAGIFWLGIGAGLLLLPSIAALSDQIIQGGTQPLLPSLEIIYPWVLALLGTSLFAGLGVSRQLISETGIGRRRLAASVGFAVATTVLIGAVFAGVSLADNAALADRPATTSRFGPTDARLTPPQCAGAIEPASTAQIELDLWGDVDGRSIGTASLTGKRSGSDVSWTAQVVRGDLFGEYGAVLLGPSAWTLEPEGEWTAAMRSELQGDPTDSDLLDTTILAQALSPTYRATAEDRGLEYVEGAPARHCRVAVDGLTFMATFPQLIWLSGDASVKAWRGQLDYWIFGDGELGRVEGFVNGAAQDILPHGLLATVNVRMTATYRGQGVAITAPRS
jgi:hypothetical protein